MESSPEVDIPAAQDPDYELAGTSTGIVRLSSSPIMSSLESRLTPGSPDSVPFEALKLALNERGFDIDPFSREVAFLTCDVDVPQSTVPLTPAVESAMLLALESFMGTGGCLSLRRRCL